MTWIPIDVYSVDHNCTLDRNAADDSSNNWSTNTEIPFFIRFASHITHTNFNIYESKFACKRAAKYFILFLNKLSKVRIFIRGRQRKQNVAFL